MNLATQIGKLAAFELLSKGEDIPVFAWRLKPDYTKNWDLQDLSQRLREQGWQIPAYPMPDDIADQWVMRIVVRNGMSMDMASMLMADITQAVKYLDSLTGPIPKPPDLQNPAAFSH